MGCQQSLIFKTSRCQGRAKAGSLRKSATKSVTSKSSQNLNNLEKSSYTLTEQDNNIIEIALLSHPLLFKARGYANRELMNRLQSFKAKKSQSIFQKGDPSNYFYIIVKGSVQISSWADGEVNKVIGRGGFFGDLGIYNKTGRSATATAKEDCQLVGLKSEYFLKFSLQFSKRAQNEVFREIKNMAIFKNLSLQQKHKLSNLAQQLKFKKGTVIFKKGEASNCLYIVKQGKVQLNVPGKGTLLLNPKQCFGQGCLNGQNSLRLASAVCLQSTVLLAFSRTDIDRYLDRQKFDLLLANKLIWAFRHEKNLRVPQKVLDRMVQNCEIRYFANNEVIAEKGQPIKHLVVSLEGGINNGFQLQIWNTDYLIDVKFYAKDLKKTGCGGDVAFIDIQSLQSSFHRNFNSLIAFNQDFLKQADSSVQIQDYIHSVLPNQFYVVENKGSGEIGCTLKIRTQGNIYLALKIFDKAKTIEEKDEFLVKNMRDIGSKIYHSLIAEQYRAYSDNHRVYFMSKWIQGEDLFDLLTKRKKLPVITAKHFSACIISIMEYLHLRRIVWRELKVESFVIDLNGYLNLIDLMYLQELPEGQSSISNTQKATFSYLAPEILANQGYGFETDFWVLGVLIYRMLVGKFPYGATISMDQDDVLDQLLEQIKNEPLQLPDCLTSDTKNLLGLLLNPSPSQRGLISFPQLKTQPFFKEYDWPGLLEKNVKNIPYVPAKSSRKLAHSIKLDSWLQNQPSELPPSSILDEFQPKK